ncbi:MAG: methyltransferase [Proteobacteria bacterium]|nr:methyltransferase [Pseudomonadota bacterium]
MARQVVESALAAGDNEVQVGLDPACGTGAFLLAMAERGVPQIRGFDLDELAVSVARVAVPQADLSVVDAFDTVAEADLVVGNPPFVPPERQNKALRQRLGQRFSWLKGRFDLCVPFSALAVEYCRDNRCVGLVLPWPILSQPYGVGLRREWLKRHKLVAISGPHPFPGASVRVVSVVLQKGRGPAPVPPHQIGADELLRLANAPLDPNIEPGDIALTQWVRRRSRPLGEVCLVDTGLVAHGPDGPKSRLMRDELGPKVVPYADARDFFRGRTKFLSYEPERMHRAKDPSMFEEPKIVIQRLRGKNPVRAAIDESGIYVGHTCTVVQPKSSCPVSLSRLLELIKSPLASAITRIERGYRLDLYPHDVAAFPIPLQWWDSPDTPIKEAFELNEQQLARCAAIDSF